jgi:hypothetical protein
MSNGIQFNNFVAFDHYTTGIESKTIALNTDINTVYAPTMYNHSVGPLINNAIIIGNTDSNASKSITTDGLVIAWDRGQSINGVHFYNFPDNESHAIRATSIKCFCEYLNTTI